MRASTAVKKDISLSKLSTNQDTSAPKTPGFDPDRLVQELLSLGHQKITPILAKNISLEVAAELKRRPAPQVTPELISEIVRFKLEESGVLQAPKPEEEETAVLFPEAEPAASENFPGREPLGFRALKTRLPTLEKWLKSPTATPLPPRAELKLSKRSLRRLQAMFSGRNEAQLIQEIESRFQHIAQQAAQAELYYPKGENPEVREIEFFNSMSNLEFLPSHPQLFDPGKSNHGGEMIWVEVDPNQNDFDQPLQEAKNCWNQGFTVGFRFLAAELAQASYLAAFEKFLNSLETQLFSLTGEGPFPEVGLHFILEDDVTRDCVALALSGKFYPKFQLSFSCSAQVLRLLNAPRETLEVGGLELRANIEKVLKDTWKKSEPSLAFPERRSAGGPVPGSGEIGQLGSLNLSFLAAANDVDWVKLRRMVHAAVRFLDNLVDATEYPSETLAKNSRTRRRLGLGVMGFAELLLKLGLPYDSEAAVSLAEKLQRFIHQEAQKASELLATERAPLADMVAVQELRAPQRHAGLTAIVEAPFAALIADVSPGLQPLENLVEIQVDAATQSHKLAPLPLLQQISEQRKIWSSKLEAEIIDRKSVRDCEAAPKPLRRLFVTKNELNLEVLLKIQAAFQNHCDGVTHLSLTQPEDADWDYFAGLLKHCEHFGIWQFSLPGNPQFEDKEIQDEANATPAVHEHEAEASAAPENPDAAAEQEGDSTIAVPAEVATSDNMQEVATSEEIEITESGSPQPPYPALQPRPRPEVMNATTRVIQTGYGPMSVLLGRDALGPYEIKAQLGKAGSRESAEAEALARLTSLLMGTGVDLKLIHEELRGIRAPRTAYDGGEEVLSSADAIALFLQRELKSELSSTEEDITVATDIESFN